MENQNTMQESVDQIYNYAADLMVNQEKTAFQTKKLLIEKGLSEESASTIITNLESQIKTAQKEAAQKDMLYGALWCVGGIVATAADIGYIFWGAILFGGIQFIKGVANS